MSLCFTNPSNTSLVDFADAGYISDSQNGRSQNAYVFTSRRTTISWSSIKQIISATSPNNSEILAIHEASRECFWLKSVIQHIRRSYGNSS